MVSDDSRTRFDAGADGYARHRPEYPAEMVVQLAGLVAAAPAGPVIDVGCGTGIFTRQLAAALPPGREVIGIEPAAPMRAIAARDAPTSIAFLDGGAEALPVVGAGAATITAATAAHWFDRPVFYAEAARALAPGGLLAILEYVRDVEASSAAAAAADFLTEEGGPRAYVRPDYAAELAKAAAFEVIHRERLARTLPLDMDGFVGLVLSSSHARAVGARLGAQEMQARLAQIAAGLGGADGTIAFGYRFDMLVARRRAS